MADVTISDHALVRYVERVLGFDLNPARQTIINTVKSAASAGASSVKSGNFTYLMSPSIKGGGIVVKTILDVGKPNKGYHG